MTIAEKTTSARNDYVGNGTRTEFPFTFEVLNEANSSTGKNYTLKVLVDDVEKTEDTDYTIGYDSATRLGSITFTTAPASSAVITLLSDISLTQSTDYINIGTGPFPADSHEGTVDKLTLIARELDEKIDRSILLPESSTLSNVTIPVSAANAGKFITVNGDGDDLTASEISETGSAVSTYMKTLLDDETAAEARATLEAQEDVITTRGDIVRGSSTGVAERLALGSSNQILVSNGTDLAYSNNQATTTSLGRLYIPNPITISNNVDDADHDIDFTAGNFDFDDGSGQATMTAKTGELDAAFGTGDGMLDTGTIASDSTYHLFPVYNPTTGDSKPLASLSKTSPTMTLPDADGYTVLGKRIAALRTDGSANIRGCTWLFGIGEYECFFKSPFSVNSAAVGTSRTLIDMDVVEGSVAIFNSSSGGSSTVTRTYFTNPDSSDIAPGNSTGNHIMANNSISSTGQFRILTNSSGQIGVRSDNTNITNLYLIAEGWKEYL